MIDRIIRCNYVDGTKLEFPVSDPSAYTQVNRGKLRSVDVLKNGQIEYTLDITPKHTFAYRLRRHKSRKTGQIIKQYIVLGKVNRREQELHFIGENETFVVLNPTNDASTGKINLRAEEAING